MSPNKHILPGSSNEAPLTPRSPTSLNGSSRRSQSWPPPLHHVAFYDRRQGVPRFGDNENGAPATQSLQAILQRMSAMTSPPHGEPRRSILEILDDAIQLEASFQSDLNNNSSTSTNLTASSRSMASARHYPSFTDDNGSGLQDDDETMRGDPGCSKQ